MIAVTFDFGQTLAELDHQMLARRLAERGTVLNPELAQAAAPAAWEAYNLAIQGGKEGSEAWQCFMRSLLGSSIESTAWPVHALADWLWQQQPAANLWRALLPGMVALADELKGAGVPLGIVSNSEGHLTSLVSELGLQELFPVVADSGALGFEKPRPEIFQWVASELGVATGEIVHIGDSWEADVQGALAVGARAIWFSPICRQLLPPTVGWGKDAQQTRQVLRAWSILS